MTLASMTWLLLLGLTTGSAETAKPYEYYCTGNCKSPKQTVGAGGIVMGGGGTDVDENFPWMAKQSGGGDFLVLRTTGTDAYNEYIYNLGGHNSVATMILKSREASELDFVVDKIRSASAIWFAGGDQSSYIGYWNGTSVQREVQAAVDRGAPVGGTSAGDAVLTGFVTVGAATSEGALANPYDKHVQIDDSFLRLPFIGLQQPGDNAVITDMHFVIRDRLGRSLAFLARLRADGRVPANVPVRAVCIDQKTSVLVDSATGKASLVGSGTAYFLSASGDPSVCKKDEPLSFSGIEAYRLTAGDQGSFDFQEWSGTGGAAYTIDVTRGKIVAPGGGYGPSSSVLV